MASSDITFLRGAATKQAQLYREHVRKMNRLRNDDFMDMAVKNQKMRELLGSTRAQYANLERDVRTRSEAIRSRVIAKAAPTDLARQDVRYMLSKNMGVHEIGRFAVEQKRPELLAALREIAPMLAAAHDLPNQGKTAPERALRDALDTLEKFEQQTATPDEQTLYNERREAEAGIGHLARNFKNIESDLSIQERAGRPQLEQLNCWPGLAGDGQYTGPISLTAQEEVKA